MMGVFLRMACHLRRDGVPTARNKRAVMLAPFWSEARRRHSWGSTMCAMAAVRSRRTTLTEAGRLAQRSDRGPVVGACSIPPCRFGVAIAPASVKVETPAATTRMEPEGAVGGRSGGGLGAKARAAVEAGLGSPPTLAVAPWVLPLTLTSVNHTSMDVEVGLMAEQRRVGRGVPLLSLEEQAVMVERHGLDTLLYCPHPWALRHRFVNTLTGEMVRVGCGRWDCLYCGPRKVDQWRQLVKAAEPTLFLTLTKAGYTVQEAARSLTTFLQYVRRGSKGRGKSRVEARIAYPVEYFGVLERHSDFEENGFHWHLLLKGVAFIPHGVLKEGWRSARHGVAYIVHIEAIRKPHVVGYVTKYLTKALNRGEKGVRVQEREVSSPGLDEQGNAVQVRRVQRVEGESKARRIRYSRQFFPERVAVLRARLFSDLEEEVECEPLEDNGKPLEGGSQGVKASAWSLWEKEEFSADLERYHKGRRAALVDALEEVRAGQRRLSRRVIGVWSYQRHEYGKS